MKEYKFSWFWLLIWTLLFSTGIIVLYERVIEASTVSKAAKWDFGPATYNFTLLIDSEGVSVDTVRPQGDDSFIIHGGKVHMKYGK